MTTNQLKQISGETKINHLFTQFEQLHNAINYWVDRCVSNWSVEAHQILDETFTEREICQKRIVRALLASGLIGELESHIRVGTFPRKAIHSAFGRI